MSIRLAENLLTEMAKKVALKERLIEMDLRWAK
jgi:hypothetical protein